MSVVRLIGDVHGKYTPYKKIISSCPASLQVGDMGVGFRKYYAGEIKHSQNPPYYKMSQGEHYFIRGNHDNPTDCKTHPFWVPDGTTHKGMFCVGGGLSIDREHRTEGLDWWRDEELSYSDFQKIIQLYSDLKPDVVVSHECPEEIAALVCVAFNKFKFEDYSITRQALQRMFEIHQPKFWFFGHWHYDIDFNLHGTNFVLLNELSYADFDTSELKILQRNKRNVIK